MSGPICVAGSVGSPIESSRAAPAIISIIRSATSSCTHNSRNAELWRLQASAVADVEAVERERLRWMIEEFRLSLFAQDLKTLLPVSAKRLDEQLELARREARGAGRRPQARKR